MIRIVIIFSVSIIVVIFVGCHVPFYIGKKAYILKVDLLCALSRLCQWNTTVRTQKKTTSVNGTSIY